MEPSSAEGSTKTGDYFFLLLLAMNSTCVSTLAGFLAMKSTGVPSRLVNSPRLLPPLGSMERIAREISLDP